MPTSTRVSSAMVNEVTAGGLVPQGPAISSLDYSQVTDTVKRTIPSDLFANGTPRAGVERTESYGTASVKNGVGNYVVGPASFWTSLGPVGTAPSVENDLTSRLRAEIKGQNLSLGQMFAEAGQTAGLIRSLATDVIRTYRQMRKGDLRAISDLVRYNPRRMTEAQHFTANQKKAANRWLEYQWGVKPLVHDIYDVANSYLSAVRRGAYRYAEASSQTHTSATSSSVLGGPWGNVKVQKGTNWYVSSRARARYFVTIPELKNLSESGLINLPSVLWEITPYSFVFDSIINIADVLDSLDALAGVSALTFIQTTLQKSETWMEFGGSYSRHAQRYFTRSSPLGTLPIPKLAFRQSGGMTKALNLVALLRQMR